MKKGYILKSALTVIFILLTSTNISAFGVYQLMQDDTLMKFQNEEFEEIDLTETDVIETPESRGVDLREYAFGIPVKQLDFSNQTPYTLSFWVNIKECNCWIATA